MKKIGNCIIRGLAGVICMLAFFSCLTGRAVYASEGETAASSPVVVNSRTTDDSVYIYIKGVESIASGTTVQIGNTLCEDIQIAGLTSMGIPVRTTILFDNSMSLSKRWGSQAKELVKALVDGHAEGEEFKIATFADGLNVVSDFSTEYESLKAAVDGIEFLDQKSYLTDILYDLLKESEGSGDANFTRFIIITDGADDNDIKYTQTELLDIMKSSGVVIHAAGVKASDNASLLENLFSYTRLTGGVCKLVETDDDVEAMKNMINEDYQLLCMKLVPQADVMDGGRKEAKLELNTSGGQSVLTTSLRMPFADVNSVQQESAEESVAETPEPTPSAEKPELPSIAVGAQVKDDTPKPQKSSIVPVIVIVAVVLAVIIAAVAVVLILKGKKKRQVDVVIADDKRSESGAQDGGERKEAEQASARQGSSAQAGGRTARLGAQQAETTGRTMRLQGGSVQPQPRQSFITLTDIANPQRSFRVPINTSIVIGRESGDILLGHDAAVSYTHCEIIKKGNLFYVKDLKSSNGTFSGNTRVNNETPIMNGGILEIGSGKYKVTIEN